MLRAQILASVAAEKRAWDLHERSHRTRWRVGIRGAGSMVAAVLVVLMLVTVLVGGRVWRDWSTFTTRPVPSPAIDQAVLAQLEARPLNLPSVPAGVECPAGPYGSYMGFGDGPVSVVFGLPAHTSWGDYSYAGAVTGWNLTGLILGRARDLNSGKPLVFVGQYAAGPVVGTDTIDGKKIEQHLEVVLDANHPPQTTQDAGKHRLWGIPVGFTKTQLSTCSGFQFDGPGFSETFVIPPYEGP
jgi:hypothetical protein